MLVDRPVALLAGTWLLTLVLSVLLGLAAIEYDWSGIPLTLGGAEIYVTIYPPLVLSTLWVLWFGYWWGAIPAYVATFVLALYSGMPLGWSVLFAFSDTLGLAILAIAYRGLPIRYDLRTLESALVFGLLAFAGSMFGATGSFIWTYTNDVGVRDVYAIWQGWWLGGFLQTVLMNGPLIILFTRPVLRWRNRHFPGDLAAAGARRRVLAGAGVLIAGIFLFLVVSFYLTRAFALPPAETTDPAVWRAASETMVSAVSVVYWVMAVIMLSMGYIGYRFFVTWADTLTRTANEAAAANDAKSQFLAQMSHEIRTPMNAVLGFTELALNEKGLPAKHHGYVTHAYEAAGTLLRLINDILDFSRIEAGKVELARDPFSIPQIFERVSSIVAHRAQGKDIAIYFETATDVPPMLVGDPVRLEQVLVNIVGNAVKFTEEGWVRVTAAVDAKDDHDVRIRFDIADTGIGMRSEEIDRLFQSFTQGDGTIARKYGGSGLGLAISRQLVELMGGDIAVESEPGRGSRFVVTARFGVRETARKPRAGAEERQKT